MGRTTSFTGSSTSSSLAIQSTQVNLPPVYSFSFLPLFFKNFRNAAQDDLKLTIPLGLQVSTTPGLSHFFKLLPILFVIYREY